MGSFIQQTQLFWATAAVLQYNAASRAMAAIAARWLNVRRLEYFDDFGIVATASAIQDALAASTELSEISGAELKIKKSQLGKKLEFLGVTVRFVIADGARQAHSSLSPDRAQELTDGISWKLERNVCSTGTKTIG